MKNINFPALLIASSLLVGCGKQTPEAQANEIAEQKLRIELANKLQLEITNNISQILCGKYSGSYTAPSHIIIASDGVYKLNTAWEWGPEAEEIANASYIYLNSKDKLIAAKVIRSQECGLKF